MIWIEITSVCLGFLLGIVFCSATEKHYRRRRK